MPGDSILYYHEDSSFLAYTDSSFTPEFGISTLENAESLNMEANGVCDGDYSCLFDIARTGNLMVGKKTHEIRIFNTDVKYQLGKKHSLLYTAYFHNIDLYYMQSI